MPAIAPPLPVEASSPTFPCPGCGSAHPWAAEHAGKTARCGCGHVLKVPAALAAPFASPVATPNAPSPLSTPEDVAEVPAFLRMPGTARIDDVPPEVAAEMAALGEFAEKNINEYSPRRDKHLPLALLAVGFVLTAIDWGFSMQSHAGAAVAGGVLLASAKLVVWMLMTLGGALLAARFAGINFGPIGPALLKLAALSLAPAALGDLATTLLGGDGAVDRIGLAVTIVAYWFLVAYFFEFDARETGIVVFAITVVKLLTAVFVGSLLSIALSPVLPGGEGFGDVDAESAFTSLEDVGDDESGQDDLSEE